MRSLVEQKVTEEILFREAVALGLDQDDQIIKRRLAQKMDFLAADLAALEEPTDAQLADWYSKHSDRFALPPHASYRHLYFSRTNAEGARTTAAHRPAGNRRMRLRARRWPIHSCCAAYGDTTPEQTAKEFGPAFAMPLWPEARFVAEAAAIRCGWHIVCWVPSARRFRFMQVSPT